MQIVLTKLISLGVSYILISFYMYCIEHSSNRIDEVKGYELYILYMSLCTSFYYIYIIANKSKLIKSKLDLLMALVPFYIVITRILTNITSYIDN